jgi:small-conductance mechanosensitive channel
MTQNAPKPKNIFDAASNLEKERREKELKSRQVQREAQKPTQDDSLNEMFRQCQQIHKEISDSLDQAFKGSNVTSTQLRTFVSNPRNFSDQDWKNIEAQKKKNSQLLNDLERQMGARKPPSLPPKKEEPPPSPEAPPPPTTPPKKPKIITRRHWIGM